MLIDSGDAYGLLYYVMPFVDGESLRDRMTREPPATAAKNWAAAEDHFERAVSHAERIRHRFALPSARQWYAEMLMARSAPGDDEHASEFLKQAVDEYQSKGMTLMLERAKPLLTAVAPPR